MNHYKSFEDLEFWKLSRNFRIKISILCKSLPPNEKYRLVDQLIRASRSITANIAEGHGRFHFQENIQYCRIARGSLMEVLDHLIVAHDEKYIDTKTLDNFRNEYLDILKLANGYTAFLKKQKQKQ